MGIPPGQETEDRSSEALEPQPLQAGVHHQEQLLQLPQAFEQDGY